MRKKFAKLSIINGAIRLIALFGMIMFGMLALPSNASAANASITLSPMAQRIILIPGETYEGSVKVLNGAISTESIKYEASVGSYNPVTDEAKGEYTGSDLTTRSNYNIMMDWTTIENATGTLEPNEVAIVTYKIKVPKDAPAGSQYMSILVTDTTPEDGVAKSGANISSVMQLGCTIYANVAGETVEKGAILDNSMPSILADNTLEAKSMVRNDGNIYTDAKYTLQVWPMFSDEEICTNEESAESTMVLPGTNRYHVQSCTLPIVGIFKAKQVVSIFDEESVLEKTVLVCPIWLMLTAALVLIGIIVWLIFRIRTHKKSGRKAKEA